MATPVFAAGNYGVAGCGLGSMLFGNQNTREHQVLAATTNGSSWNQTFAMSSGTLNCSPQLNLKTAEVKKNMNMFISANNEALAVDIAKQNGETILALSQIVGCKDAQYLGTKLQSRYSTIYQQNSIHSVTNNMYDVIASDNYLAENCQL